MCNPKNVMEKFYYLRDANNIPIITICIALDVDSGDFARGMAICSTKDNPNKKEGKRIARRRAIRALGSKTTSLPIKDSRAIDSAIYAFAHKTTSIFQPNSGYYSKSPTHEGIFTIYKSTYDPEVEIEYEFELMQRLLKSSGKIPLKSGEYANQ